MKWFLKMVEVARQSGITTNTGLSKEGLQRIFDEARSR